MLRRVAGGVGTDDRTLCLEGEVIQRLYCGVRNEDRLTVIDGRSGFLVTEDDEYTV